MSETVFGDTSYIDATTDGETIYARSDFNNPSLPSFQKEKKKEDDKQPHYVVSTYPDWTNKIKQETVVENIKQKILKQPVMSGSELNSLPINWCWKYINLTRWELCYCSLEEVIPRLEITLIHHILKCGYIEVDFFPYNYKK